MLNHRHVQVKRQRFQWCIRRMLHTPALPNQVTQIGVMDPLVLRFFGAEWVRVHGPWEAWLLVPEAWCRPFRCDAKQHQEHQKRLCFIALSSNTVAILAQGTSWAVAVTQAFCRMVQIHVSASGALNVVPIETPFAHGTVCIHCCTHVIKFR